MFSWLLESTILAACLALIAAVLPRWRRLGPATRHLLWLLVVVRLVTPPLLSWPVAWERESIAAAPTASMEMAIEPAPPIEAVVADLPTIESLVVPESAPESVAIAAPDLAAIEIEPPTMPPIPWSSLLMGLWAVGSIAWAGNLAWQVGRFQSGLAGATEAPKELLSILDEVGQSMGVRPPRVRVVDDLESPMLWCLARPVLLVPSSILGTLGPDAWRGVLAHELAHLRRGDHWVGRLLMVGGALLWWHPLFRIARSRVEAEAELACDAWVVGTLPDCRRRYAEALVDVCEVVSLGRIPAPALGVGSRPGRLLERRLIMILQERVSPRTSPSALLALGLLGALSLPSWTRAQDEPEANVVVTSDEPKVETKVDVVVIPDDPKAESAPKAEAADPTKKTETKTVERKIVVRKDDDGKAHFEVQVDGKNLELDALKALPGMIQSQIQLKGVDGDEIAKKVREALEKANIDEATRAKIMEQMKDLHVKVEAMKVQGRSQLSAAEAQVQRAKAQLAAAEARLKAETERLSSAVKRGESEAKVARLNRALAAPRADGAARVFGAVPGQNPFTFTAPNADLEKRMEKLESKVDALLDELKAMRKEKSEKSDDSKPKSEARAVFSHEIGARR